MGKNNKIRELISNLKKYFLNKSSFPLYIFLIIYSAFYLPLCFINNDYFNFLSAFHIDSGSIIASIFTIMNKDIFYNQNMGYHTSYYGFPYNSLLFFIFSLLRKIFHLSVVDNFSIFATAARIASFFISFLTIYFTFILSSKIIKNNFFSFLVILFLAIYPGFSFYISLIKPDILALLFLTLSFLLLYLYINKTKPRHYIFAIVFASLATFTKQQYIFISIPLVLAYFLKEKYVKINYLSLKLFFIYYLKAAIIIIPIFFLIHPFLFINFSYFFGRQIELTGMTSAPIIENFNFWKGLYFRYPITLLGFFIALSTTITYYFERKKEVTKKIIFLFSVFSLLYILWLTFFVGPIRSNAYLLPFFSFISINVFNVFSRLLIFKKSNNIAIIKVLRMLIFFIFFVVLVISIKNMLDDTIFGVKGFYNFKKSFQVYVVKDIMLIPPVSKKLNKTKIIFTASLPFPQYKFKEAKNIWQFNFGKTFIDEIKSYDPDIIAVDTTKYYEQSYTWWKKTALNLGFANSKIYLNNKIINEANFKKVDDKNVIVIFYLEK